MNQKNLATFLQILGQTPTHSLVSYYSDTQYKAKKLIISK